MNLEKIITFTSADDWNRIRFLAMERSLRNVDCDLPIWVIPYNDTRFELPKNSHWIENSKLFDYLRGKNVNNLVRKYQCLLESNYQFVDTDVIFLKNPVKELQNYTGFITSCGHWHNPFSTYTEQSLALFKERTTIWQKNVFNVGQFACDDQLFTFEELISTVENPAYKATCLTNFKYSDQVGLNLLVALSDIAVTNMQLQAPYIESTWAGDYWDDYEEIYWKDNKRKPYFIHWAGLKMNEKRPIDALFFEHLAKDEKEKFQQLIEFKYSSKDVKPKYGILQKYVVRTKLALDLLLKG